MQKLHEAHSKKYVHASRPFVIEFMLTFRLYRLSQGFRAREVRRVSSLFRQVPTEADPALISLLLLSHSELSALKKTVQELQLKQEDTETEAHSSKLELQMVEEERKVILFLRVCFV